MKISRGIFSKIGVLPVIDHFYQPLINPHKHLLKSLRLDRNLPGIDFNIETQINLLDSFNFNDELKSFPLKKTNPKDFYFHNGSLMSGDSEYLYNIIRSLKPKNIIEIGSGHSTKMMLNGINKNYEEDNIKCELTCIEPYEEDLLKGLNINLIKERVEKVDIELFNQLDKNDILFIDSSHIIRPQGDVLFEFNEILPSLKPGVLVHIHDIFSPKDYLDEWILDKHIMWNEQYLLENFLTFNKGFEIIGSLNYLKHNYWDELTSKCPILQNEPNREPGSFWIRRI
jgi:predicted O-methyltransferase YrrM